MSKDSSKKTSILARNIALRYLSRCQRSVKEVEQKLGSKEIDADAVKETIQYLAGLGYLNDERFAKDWTGSKLCRSWGRNKIINGLRLKGIDEEIIKSVVDSAVEQSDERTAALRALEKWLRLRRNKKNNSENLRQSAFRHLYSRGFTGEIAADVIKELIEEE